MAANQSKDELERIYYDTTLQEFGVWSYTSGSGNGTSSGSGRIVGITVFAPTDGSASFSVASGATIIVPANGVFNFTPRGLAKGTVTIANSASWVVERVN